MKLIQRESLLQSHDHQLGNRFRSGLLGALLLGAGLATSLASADEPTQGDQGEVAAEKVAEPAETSESSASSDQRSTSDSKQERDRDADLVRVRISLPDGRTIVRLEPVRSRSARRTVRTSSTSSSSRYLPDGSRISVGGRAVSGGSNGSSVKHGGSGGGGGGGSAMSRSGGGGGGGGVVTTKALAKDVRSRMNGQATIEQGQENEQAETELLAFENESFEMNASTPGGASTANSPSSGGSFARHQGARAVPTVGGARFDREGNATGGQRVEFHDAGMNAAVIGNMVYFNGVELVNADQPFTVLTGTRIGTDSVVMDDQRFSPGDGPIGSFNTGSSAIKIELEQGAVVDLVMLSRSDNPSFPDRQERTWTVRIR